MSNLLKKQRPKIVSLFSGCGGMDLGAEWAGGQVIWANELNTDACQTYQNYYLFKDTNLVPGSIEDMDLSKELPFTDVQSIAYGEGKFFIATTDSLWTLTGGAQNWQKGGSFESLDLGLEHLLPGDNLTDNTSITIQSGSLNVTRILKSFKALDSTFHDGRLMLLG